MKKVSLFLVALMSLNVFLVDHAEAKKSKTKVLARMAGQTLGDDIAPAKKSNNIFYDNTIGKKAPAPEAPKATPVPTPMPEAGTGSVNKDIVKKNQSKEAHMSMGMVYLGKDDLDGAMGEFKKAQAVMNDQVVQRWIKVVNTKKRIKEVNKIIDNMNDTKRP